LINSQIYWDTNLTIRILIKHELTPLPSKNHLKALIDLDENIINNKFSLAANGIVEFEFPI
jgi:hypothetical protein